METPSVVIRRGPDQFGGMVVPRSSFFCLGGDDGGQGVRYCVDRSSSGGCSSQKVEPVSAAGRRKAGAPRGQPEPRRAVPGEDRGQEHRLGPVQPAIEPSRPQAVGVLGVVERPPARVPCSRRSAPRNITAIRSARSATTHVVCEQHHRGAEVVNESKEKEQELRLEVNSQRAGGRQ